jgi:hypothetical protein
VKMIFAGLRGAWVHESRASASMLRDLDPGGSVLMITFRGRPDRWRGVGTSFLRPAEIRPARGPQGGDPLPTPSIDNDRPTNLG